VFREETLIYSAQGVRWKITTNQAHTLTFILRIYTVKMLKKMLVLPISYSLLTTVG